MFQIETKLRKFVAQCLIINVPYECDMNVLKCVLYLYVINLSGECFGAGVVRVSV